MLHYNNNLFCTGQTLS